MKKLTKEDLIQLEKEIKQVKKSKNENEKCIIIDAANVYVFNSKTKLNLVDYFEKVWPKNLVGPGYSFCFTTPGEITTLKNVHIHCLKCYFKYILVKYYLEDAVPEDCLVYIKRYVPNLLKKIK
ncbi:MAG: hypothetical protein IKB42_00385 [Clostridia bacterium]|nr:hypothetical protein [Clostridia bacterium]